MTGHEYDQHADAPQHSNAPQHDQSTTSSQPQSTAREHQIRKLGTKFGSRPPTELTAAEIQTLGDEIEAIESLVESGNYLTAVIRLNAFWDDWTTAAVEAKIKADSLQKQVCPKYGSQLEQANAYGLLGDEIHAALKELNNQRHKPGHQTWSDIDHADPAFQNALAKALVLSKRHHEHLQQEHT